MTARNTHSPTTFHWKEAATTIGTLAGEHGLALEDKRRWFEAQDNSGTQVHPPIVYPIDARCRSVDDYLASLGDAPGVQVVILMQAGAVALGWCDGGEVVSSKVFKRYVVRGRGRAQQTHLSTKGKSRYGSRLRLRNAQRLLEETNERLADWWTTRGAPEHVFVNAPKPLWSSLFEVTPLPPFNRDHPTTRIPRDLPVPTEDVLKRAYKSLCYGRIETS